jgi:uncharacterized protein YndB with AHSA1/START domain
MSEIKPFSISRVFNAPRALVYKVHSEPGHVAKWFGPAGTKVIKFDMDFRVGRLNHYGIEIPGGIKMWGKQVYKEITPLEKIVHVQSFSDENGGMGRHPMDPNWPQEMLATTTFEDAGPGKTKVTITWLPINANEVELAAFDGAREGMIGGFNGQFDTMENYLAAL